MNRVPKLRFKEFSGDWEEKKLGEITTLTAGGTPSTLKKEYWNGSIKWMSSGELNLKFIYDVQGRITDLGLKNSSTKIIPKECILIGLAGQGKTRGTVAINFVELCTNQSIASIFPNFDCFKPMFLYYNLDNRYEELRNLSTGSGGRGGLNLNILKNISSFFPNLNEQQEIADFLFSVDKKISITEEKLGLFKDYKKGIMQKIFNQELRFKDSNGNDYPEWEEKRLGDITTNISSGKTLIKLETGSFNLYGSTGKIGFTNVVDYCGENILIARVGANAGTLNFINEECGITDNTLVTSVKNNNSNKWLYYYLVSYNLNRLIFGSGQPLITGSLLKKICLNVPCLEEQQKIANFLSSIDNKIDNLTSELEDLKEFKKGLLQQMFV